VLQYVRSDARSGVSYFVEPVIPHDNENYTFGYDDPREHFPAELVALLDEKLPPSKGWSFLW
jgi:hypothetical protein